MENLGCEICFEDYDDSKVVPKVLDCGHTICVYCINNMQIIQIGLNDPRCPRCRKPFPREKKYATNYSLLSLVQQKNFHMKGKPVEDEFSQIIEKLKNWQRLQTQKIDPQQKVSQVAKKCYNKLKESKKDEETDVYTIMSTIINDLAEKEKTSQRNLKIVTQLLTQMEVQDACEASGHGASSSPMEKAVEMKPDFSLRDFDNRASYLKEIRDRLQDQMAFVAHPFETKILYGKLSFENISLSAAWKVSVLEAKEVPNGAFIIELQDLKEALTDYSVCTFLEIRKEEDGDGGIVIIDMKPSLLSSQFVKLCTGECGVSYKHYNLITEDTSLNGCAILKGGILFEERPKGLSDFNLFPQSNMFKSKQIIVRTNYDGSMWLCYTILDYSLTDGVGVARSHPDNDKILFCGVGTSWKVEDCGIYFCSKNPV